MKKWAQGEKMLPEARDFSRGTGSACVQKTLFNKVSAKDAIIGSFAKEPADPRAWNIENLF